MQKQEAIFENEYSVMYTDIDNNLEITDIAILKYLQEIGIFQTQEIFGSMITPKGVWVLLNWKIKKLKTLHWNEKFKLRTWAAKHTGPFAIRNYEIYNEQNELIVIASSKWVLMDVVTKKMVRNIEDIISKYIEYDKMVFDDDISKLKEPENLEYTYNYIVQKRDIDTNGHVNNTKYLEIAYEALPETSYDKYSFKNIEVMYKHSAFLGDKMHIGFEKQIIDGIEQYTIVIKSNEELNAIIRLS